MEYVRGLLANCEVEDAGDYFVAKTDKRNVADILRVLLDKMQINSLMDLMCIHYPGRERCFCLIYNLLSLSRNVRIMVEIGIMNDEPAVSIHDVFPNSVWYEREIYDMYGVKFINCPDDRRILMYTGFEGYPLRKDFPLTGYVELRYDIEKQAVVETSVDLEQDYRGFNESTSPWKGTKYTEGNNSENMAKTVK